MNPIVKYLQETRMEMRHVAWPTRTQTIIYTVLVVALSLGVSLYLGLFDYIYTTMLQRGLAALPAPSALQMQTIPAGTNTNAGPADTTTTQNPTNAPVQDNGPLKIVPDTTDKTSTN